MKEIKVPGIGSVFHPGTVEETSEHQRVVDARRQFIESYCRDKGWPNPCDPDFEDRISWGQVLEMRAQEGWKNPLGEGAPPESTIVLTPEGAFVAPKGRN